MSKLANFLIHVVSLYARYICLRDALGLKAERGAARDDIGYLVYKLHPLLCAWLDRSARFACAKGKATCSNYFVIWNKLNSPSESVQVFS